jgi:phage shock protein PspC (stress-responsive transcriptional regulator)
MEVMAVLAVVFLALSFLMNCIIFYIIIKAFMDKDEESIEVNQKAFASIPGGGIKRPQK